MPAASAASAPDFDLDPYSFRAEDGGVFRAFGAALCAAPAPAAETLTVRARVAIDRCDDPDWAALGVNAWFSPNDYWQLAAVKSPDNSGSKHRFELKAMVKSVWGGEKNLATSLGRKKHADWQYGREYDFELRCSPDRIEGEIRDAETGKPVFSEAFSLPEGYAPPWRPALYVNGRMQGAFSGVEAEAGGEASHPDAQGQPRAAGRSAAPPYRPSGPDTGLRGTATGFFHIETIDGRDWPIDPTGRAVILAATQHIKPQGTHSDALGHSPYGRYVATHYPSAEAWADETLARLSDWGFTMLGNACPLGLLGHKTLPHVRNIQLGQRVCRGDPDWYIREWKYAPCTALPNVFHPKFAEACEWRAREQCAPFKDDPWIVGWFIDNELAWWGNRTSMPATGLFDAVAALPGTHSARRELVRWLGERSAAQAGDLAKVPSEIKTEFLRHYARTYYEKTVSAIRKADPNHMVMGSRYAGISGAHPVVFEEAGRQCDVVTFNCYPWVDLDRGIVLDEKGGTPIADLFREYHGYAQKPFMITEWSFPAIDNGHPCLVGAGQRMNTQAERTEATMLFARTMLADPHVIGYDYFKWNDQPRQGASRWSPEDCNYGLVDDENQPYEGIVGAFKALHGDLVKWRTAPPPEGATPQVGARTGMASERDRFFAEAAAGGAAAGPVAVLRDGDRYVLSNGLVRLSGRIGSKWLADEVAFAGGGGAPGLEAVGHWGALVSCRDGGTNVWIDISRLASVSFERDVATGAVTALLRGEGSLPGGAFAIEQRLTIAPGLRDVLAEITAFENLGEKTVEMRSIYMRPFPLGGKSEPVEFTPKLWKAPERAAWTLPGGGSWGVSSKDPPALGFKFWVKKENGSVHPDAAFCSAGAKGAVAVAPGETWVPTSPMGARISRNPQARQVAGRQHSPHVGRTPPPSVRWGRCPALPVRRNARGFPLAKTIRRMI